MDELGMDENDRQLFERVQRIGRPPICEESKMVYRDLNAEDIADVAELLNLMNSNYSDNYKEGIF